MYDPYDDYMYDIITSDDEEKFLPVLEAVGRVTDLQLELLQTFILCAQHHAKKCLLAMIKGEVCPPAYQIYEALAPKRHPKIPTPLASVASLFPEADDIIDLLLNEGPLHHANIKCQQGYFAPYVATPLDHALLELSDRPHLSQWCSGASLIKLMILLCQWESKPILYCARLLAPYTDGINEIALSYVKHGKLVPLAALLLVVQEKVLLPFSSGLTIRQHVNDMLQKLSSEGDLDYEGAIYQSMLIEACKLFDIFERAGAALSSYSSSMHEYVPPHKVLIDVVSLFKKAGYALEPIDHDLRDCYRNNPELRKATMYKLSDPAIPNNKYRLPSSLTWPHGFGTFVSSYPYPGYCQLFHKLKTGPVVNLNPCVLQPRLLRTVAGHAENGCSGITGKHLTSIAFRLKRGVKF